MNSQNTYSSGASFTIQLISTTSRINMYSTGGLASIGTISISGSTSVGLVDVVIGSGALSTNRDTDLSNAAHNWGGVSFPFNARLSGAIAGNLTGAINPTSIVRLEVHGQVSGAISAAPVSGTAIGRLQLGSTTSGGTITVGDSTTGGDLLQVEVESGTLAGGVFVGGKLQVLDCAGDIAIAANPGITARDGIDTIQADDISAHIVANVGSSTGALSSMACDNFTGSLTAYTMYDSVTPASSGIVIDGDLDGTLDFDYDVNRSIHVTGAFLEGSSVHVGGNLYASVTADGDVTAIDVDGYVTHVAGDAIHLGSIHGDVERIASTLGFTRDDFRPGPEVYFIGGRIEEILGGPPEGSFSTVISGRLEALEVGTITARGSMQLDLSLLDFDRIEVWQSFEWDDPTSESLQIGGDGLFVIGNYCGAELRFGPTADFTGQVIVNASDIGGQWTYPAQFYDWFLDEFHATDPHAYYENFGVEASYPGAAIGLVPFHLHRAYCEPPHSPDSTCFFGFPVREWPDSTERQTIVLQHYGPVFDSLDNDPKPVLVYLQSVAICLPAPCPSEYGDLVSWTDKTEFFDVHTPGGGSREVWISRVLDEEDDPQPFNTMYSYQIDLVTEESVTQLRSDLTLASTPPNVGGYPYTLNMLCLDLNMNMAIEPGDIDAWLNEPVDVNRDESVDGVDILTLIEAVGGN